MLNDEGWCIGAEIGAYVEKNSNDHILEAGEFTLRKMNGPVLINKRRGNGQYWINAFVEGRNDEASNLIMDVVLRFFHEQDAKNFCDSFNLKLLNKSNAYFGSNKGKDGKREFYELIFDPERLEPDGKTVYFSWR
jgi:hypothetical protein